MTGFVGDWWARHRPRITAALTPDVLARIAAAPDAVYDVAELADAGLFPSLDLARFEAQRRCIGGTVFATAVGFIDTHHAHHLWAAGWEYGTQIIEFGGGYGNLAALARRFGAADTPYVIIDFPEMGRLQSAYLDGVGAHGVTVTDLDAAAVVCADVIDPDAPVLFIANFSLDEAPAAVTDRLVGCEWFGATRASVALQHTGKVDMFPDGPALHGRLAAAGFDAVDAHISGCVYLVGDPRDIT